MVTLVGANTMEMKQNAIKEAKELIETQKGVLKKIRNKQLDDVD